MSAAREIRNWILNFIKAAENRAEGRQVSRKEVIQRVKEHFPNAGYGTISGQHWQAIRDPRVEKVLPGIAQWKTTNGGDDSPSAEASGNDSLSGGAPQERDFYAPCAKYLKEAEECTKAVALGGNYLGNVYGTPDVIGVLDAPVGLNDYNLPREIVSVEIKTETLEADLMKGFGQACAYIAFSHRSYLAVPESVLPSSQQRLVFLCLRFGVGLILFDLNAENPDFSIKVQAQSRMPDSSFLHGFVEKFRRSDANATIIAAQEKLKI